jgi:hypothetical protein
MCSPTIAAAADLFPDYLKKHVWPRDAAKYALKPKKRAFAHAFPLLARARGSWPAACLSAVQAIFRFPFWRFPFWVCIVRARLLSL